MKFTLLLALVVVLLSLDRVSHGFTLKFNFWSNRDDNGAQSSAVSGQNIEQSEIENEINSLRLGDERYDDEVPIASRYLSDKYIVTFKKDSNFRSAVRSVELLLRSATRYSTDAYAGIKDHFDLGSGLHGFIGHLDEGMLAALGEHEDVEHVEKDQLVFATDVENGAPWGLSRISHRARPLGSEQTTYYYDGAAGSGVVAYVIDTGVNIGHSEFSGRATWGATIPKGDADIDNNGHGTHVSGTIGGKNFGVAKDVDIVAVKVLRSDGSGTLSDVILGIQWAVNDHQSRVKNGGKKTKSVANMSLGGGRSRVLDAAVDAAVQAGIHFAVAAGNENEDACNSSPSASKYAITVGATTIDDERAWFSNWGPCVDIFAPGHQILSSWIGSSNATNTISGTSMASPHVAGLLALWLSEERFATFSTDELKTKLITLSTKGVISHLSRDLHTKNRLLYSDPPHAA